MSIADTLHPAVHRGTLGLIDDEEQGIYREEVRAIIGGLADISSDTQILAILRGEDEEEDEEAEDDS